MSTDLPFTSEDIAEIVAILDGTAYETLDIRTSRFVLRVARAGTGWTQDLSWRDSGADAGRPAGGTGAPAAAPPAIAEPGVTAIISPLPGMFYRRPEPGAPPFVEVGGRVEPDTVVAIVEAMKLMTAVHAGCSGLLETILVEDATLIAADQPIMRVRLDP